MKEGGARFSSLHLNACSWKIGPVARNIFDKAIIIRV